MATEIKLFEFPDLSLLDLCLGGWMKSEVNKRKLDTPDELLARILDAAEDHFIRTARCIRVRDMQSALKLTVGFSKIYLEL
jgi:hypothetical protein